MPPFVKNEVIAKESECVGKSASTIKTIPLGSENATVKHVLSSGRPVFMLLNSQEERLNVSFMCKHGDSDYTVFASV